MIYLIEPYNPYDKNPKNKKKHWMQIAEEEALFYKIMEQQKALQEAKSKSLPPDAPPTSLAFLIKS